MTTSHLRIGSRGSELALWQAEWVRRTLEEKFPDVQCSITIIRTEGDRILDTPLSQMGDRGIFIREIETELLAGTIDLAVHSLKDLPTTLPAGLDIAAITERADVRDVFIPHPLSSEKNLFGLPEGSVIATGSLRRRAQILHRRPDYRVVDLRGNLGTRFRKLDESQWAGMVLARAGVERLNLLARTGESIEPEIMLPAVGQGALAVETRKDDRAVHEIVHALHHETTATAVIAERALLRTLEGGCQIPLGAFGRVTGAGELALDGMVGSLDGRNVVRDAVRGTSEEPEALGQILAARLLQQGAGKILDEIRKSAQP
jgi:hydroxymethylbilane synthase